MQKYNPVECINNPPVNSIYEAFIDKKTPTLASVQRQKGYKIASAMIKTWIIYLNELLNSKTPFTETQIHSAAGIILDEYYMFRFADLAVLFRNIIKDGHGKEFGPLTIDKFLKLFKAYFEQRCNLSESHNYSKSIEHRQNLEDLGTERITKTRR